MSTTTTNGNGNTTKTKSEKVREFLSDTRNLERSPSDVARICGVDYQTAYNELRRLRREGNKSTTFSSSTTDKTHLKGTAAKIQDFLDLVDDLGDSLCAQLLAHRHKDQGQSWTVSVT